MWRYAARTITASAAAAALTGLGIGTAMAVPTLSADDTEEGTIAVGSAPERETWSCLLLGAAEAGGPRVDMAQVGDSRGGFAPGSTVAAGCMGPQAPMVTVVTGVTSLDDAD